MSYTNIEKSLNTDNLTISCKNAFKLNAYLIIHKVYTNCTFFDCTIEFRMKTAIKKKKKFGKMNFNNFAKFELLTMLCYIFNLLRSLKMCELIQPWSVCSYTYFNKLYDFKSILSTSYGYLRFFK